MAAQYSDFVEFLHKRANRTAGNIEMIDPQALMDVPIPLPPLPEQPEIARRLSAAFARLDAAASAHAAAVAVLNRLDQSWIARAFSSAL